MYLQSIKSVKLNAAKSVNRSILKKSRHLGFGVFKIMYVCEQLTCEYCGKRFSRRSTLEQHVALHGATSSSDWEEIQDAALHDLEQAAAFGALAGELGYANFSVPSSPLDRFAANEGRDDEEEESFSFNGPAGNSMEVKREEGTTAGAVTAKGSAGQRGEGSRCPTCGKTFSRQSLLNRHLKLHAGIKPYLCTVSTRTFIIFFTVVTYPSSHQCWESVTFWYGSVPLNNGSVSEFNSGSDSFL
jgi:hypothetical protein